MIPALKESVRVREEPQGAVLLYGENNDAKYILASPLEAFIFSLFDGTRTIEDIVDLLTHIKHSPGKKEVQNIICDIIQNKSEIIDLINTPIKKSRVQIDPYNFLFKPDINCRPMRLHAPVSVDLYVTRRCNLNCMYCFANAKYTADQIGTDSGEMSLEKIKCLIDQIAEFKIKKMLITGGEPTLRRDLPEIVHHFMNHGIEVTLATNACSINEELARKLRDLGIREIQAKLDASNPKTQDKLSGVKGSYEKLIEGIKRLKNYSFNVSIVSVATSWNIREIPEVIKICAALGISEVEPRIYSPGMWALSGRGGSYLNPSPSSILWLEKKIGDLQKEYKDIISISFDSSSYRKKNENEVPRCPGFISTCTVLENGLVVPCEVLADFSKDFIMGDANKESLTEIWNSEKAKKWALRKYPEVSGPCLSCDEFERCRGGCPWKSLVAYGKWTADPFCVRANDYTQIPFPEVPTCGRVPDLLNRHSER